MNKVLYDIVYWILWILFWFSPELYDVFRINYNCYKYCNGDYYVCRYKHMIRTGLPLDGYRGEFRW